MFIQTNEADVLKNRRRFNAPGACHPERSASIISFFIAIMSAESKGIYVFHFHLLIPLLFHPLSFR